MQFCVFTHRETGRPTPIEHPNVAHTLNSSLSIRNYPLYVFSMRQQMVIGPTPPGTGVMTDPLGSTDSKSTSPQRFPFSSLSMPTSITAAPTLTMSPVTNLGRPIATTRMSACREISGRLRVLEWQMVTVAFLSKRSFAIGKPTIWLRPITTASHPRLFLAQWLQLLSAR